MDCIADYGSSDEESELHNIPQHAHIAPEVDKHGRVRAFPHAAGNWATHVFISVDHLEEIREASTTVIESARRVLSRVGFDVQAIDDGPVHVSLSRTVVLHYHQIESFVANCRQVFSQKAGFQLRLAPKLACFTNDIAARSFLALDVVNGVANLVDLIHCIDRILAQYKQAPYYQPAHFHASICWWPSGSGMSEVQLSELQQVVDAADLDDAELWVSSVDCKIGDRNYTFKLS